MALAGTDIVLTGLNIASGIATTLCNQAVGSTGRIYEWIKNDPDNESIRLAAFCALQGAVLAGSTIAMLKQSFTLRCFSFKMITSTFLTSCISINLFSITVTNFGSRLPLDSAIVGASLYVCASAYSAVKNIM